MDREEVLAGVGKIEWWHSINLGVDLVTPGRCNCVGDLGDMYMPNDLTGKRVLDIGAWDGFYAFEAEKRGAKEVVAMDLDVPGEGSWAGSGKSGFLLAREVLGSRVKDLVLSIYDLDREKLGGFDLVLFLNVIYHLRHPLYAIGKIYDICDGMVIICSAVNFCDVDAPVMEFCKDGKHGDPTNFWYPNISCLYDMMLSVGFGKVEVVFPNEGYYDTRGEHRAVLHGWK